MNKNDTISREYLLAEIDDLADEFSELDENGLHSERWCGISDAKRVIINTPFVSDRPQGKWIIHFDDIWPEESTIECSVCHEEQPLEIDDNFCPNCGARMKGASNENNR